MTQIRTQTSRTSLMLRLWETFSKSYLPRLISTQLLTANTTTMALHTRTTTLMPRLTPTPHQLSKAIQMEFFLTLLKNWRSTSVLGPSPMPTKQIPILHQSLSHPPTPSNLAQTDVNHQLHRKEHCSKGQLLHQRTRATQKDVGTTGRGKNSREKSKIGS